MKHYTMKEIRASYTAEKRACTSVWARVFSRPLSFPVTWLLINLGVSANQASILSIAVALAACAFLMAGPSFVWAGTGLFLFWDVLDCTDGNIARVKKRASAAGEYLDAVSGYTAPAFIYLAVGVAAYHTAGFPKGREFVMIVLGAVASISDILSRLIYQKYVVTEYRLGIAAGGKTSVEEKRGRGIGRIADGILRNLTYSSLFMPLLVLAAATARFDVLISLYALYSAAVLAGTFVYFIRRGLALANGRAAPPDREDRTDE